MSKYSYIARTKEAVRETGTIDAATQDEAIASLQNK